MKLPILEVAGIWALAIVGAYGYADQINAKYAQSLNLDDLRDLTHLLQIKVDAVVGYGLAYSLPVCLFMIIVFLIRARAHGSWFVTATLISSSVLIILITDRLVINSVL
jgi:hypothetical protein